MKSTEKTDLPNKTQDLMVQALLAMRANGSSGQITTVSVCDEVVATLLKMETDLVGGIKAGLIDISEKIAADQTMAGTPERIVLELVAESTKGLTQAISEVFEQHRSVVTYQRNRFVLGKINPMQVSAEAKLLDNVKT